MSKVFNLTTPPLIYLEGRNTYSKELSLESGMGSMTRLQNLVTQHIATAETRQQRGVDDTKAMIQLLTERAEVPFEKEEEYLSVAQRLAVVNTEIELSVSKDKQVEAPLPTPVQSKEEMEDGYDL